MITGHPDFALFQKMRKDDNFHMLRIFLTLVPALVLWNILKKNSGKTSEYDSGRGKRDAGKFPPGSHGSGRCLYKRRIVITSRNLNECDSN